MRTFLVLALAVSSFSLAVPAPSIAGPCSQDAEAPGVFVPDRGCASLGFGYQYQHYDIFGRSFNNNGFNMDFGIHLFDALTGAGSRIAVGAEGTGAFGFDGHTSGTPVLSATSLFLGAGPHVSVASGSRFEPWLHGLVGWEHLRFTQTATLGSNSALGFMLGGGLDVRVKPKIYWRVQGDYLGTHFQFDLQSNYSVGSGFIFYF